MNRLAKSLALWVLISTPLMSFLVQAQTCDLPYNRYQATVLGHCQTAPAKLPAEINVHDMEITLLPNQQIPEVFWYNKNFKFSVANQRFAAPLVFNIAGTGAKYDSPKMIAVQKALFKAGFHVINISSPTFSNFIINGLDKSAHMPGYLEKDAEQLYLAMQETYKYAQQELGMTATEYHLTGYSLGGAHSAYVSLLDEERKAFNFNSVVLINPPWNLHSSVSILDNYLHINTHNEREDAMANMNNILNRLRDSYSNLENVNFGGGGLYHLAKGADLSNEELRLLIGVAFRLSSSDMIFAIDAMYNIGAVTYKNHTISKFESVRHSLARAGQIGFMQYFERGMLPYYQQTEPELNEEVMIRRLGMRNIEDYLSNSSKIHLMHNADDIILKDGEIEKFQEVFGDRAQIFEQGGHCGNMDRQYFVDHLVSLFNASRG